MRHLSLAAYAREVLVREASRGTMRRRSHDRAYSAVPVYQIVSLNS
jgi:hypothetical protein